MMKQLALSLLLFFAPCAFADCVLPVTGPFTFAPWPVGSGSPPNLRYVTGGAVVWWYSSDRSTFRVAAATSKTITRTFVLNLEAAMLAAAKASDPLGAFNDAAAQITTVSITDPSMQALWCPLLPTMQAGVKK